MFEIQYFGAAWCGPCRTQKPLVMALAQRYGVPITVFDIDDAELDPTIRDSIQKLPTIRIQSSCDGQLVEFVTKQAEQLEAWLRSNVRVNTSEDF